LIISRHTLSIVNSSSGDYWCFRFRCDYCHCGQQTRYSLMPEVSTGPRY